MGRLSGFLGCCRSSPGAWAALRSTRLGGTLPGGGGGLLAAAFFLFTPFATVASRAFMPDPLMVSLRAGALWAGVRWSGAETPASGRRWAVVAGLLTGTAILVKAVAAFMLGPFWVVLVLVRLGWGAFRSAQVGIIGVLSLLPVGVYYAYGLFVSGALRQQFSSRFFPELWADPSFYSAWGQMIDRVVGWPWVLVAFLGVATIQDRAVRASLAAWGLGYLALGFTLSHHVSTHDYYTLPLLPVVATGVGAAGAAVFRRLAPGRATAVAAVIAVIVALVMASASAYERLREDYRPQADRWAEIASSFSPDDQIVGLAAEYGHPFRYLGWRNYTWWPTTFDRALMPQIEDFPSYWRVRTAGMDYFLVTVFDQLESQPDLQAHLATQCSLVVQEPSYWVYDLSPDPPFRGGGVSVA